jgi:hypothetical protein
VKKSADIFGDFDLGCDMLAESCLTLQHGSFLRDDFIYSLQEFSILSFLACDNNWLSLRHLAYS